MAKKEEAAGFGELPPQYTFALNPYPDLRFTTCPHCQARTGQRKLPLVIHIEPKTLVALNYTNRHCKRCDLLIGHKHEIEHLLTVMFLSRDAQLIGNDYVIFATLQEKAWREGTVKPKPILEARPNISDFRAYEELGMTRAGWYRAGEEAPIVDPPPSTEWVKHQKNNRN